MNWNHQIVFTLLFKSTQKRLDDNKIERKYNIYVIFISNISVVRSNEVQHLSKSTSNWGLFT